MTEETVKHRYDCFTDFAQLAHDRLAKQIKNYPEETKHVSPNKRKKRESDIELDHKELNNELRRS